VTVRTLTWAALRVSTEQLVQAASMADALGLTALSASPSQLMLQTSRGDVLEYCGPDCAVPDYFFTNGDTVLGFEVDSIADAAGALERAGFRILCEPSDAGPVRYQHFEGPDGRTYAIITPAVRSNYEG
jgi:hypothetical protein